MMSRRWVWAVGLSFVLSPLVHSQAVPELTDNFEDDPVESGWILNGDAVWVQPGGAECVDPNNPDPFDPCTLYPDGVVDNLEGGADAFGGYILVTPGQNNRGGNAFFSEPTLFENFTMEVVIEIRDGSIARPADGMTIMLLGTEDPPTTIGGGGGSMGATGLGAVPTMIFEFDDWNNGASDQNSDNHVGFHWSPDGAGLTNDVLVPIQDVRLHNQQPHPADPNRFKMTVVVRDDGLVRCALEAVDQGVDLGVLYEHEIPDFVPFEGYFGVTGSTGGANQNHILHSVRIFETPPCLDAVAVVAREFDPPREREDFCGGDFQAGDVVGVALSLNGIRAADGECTAPESLTIVEILPGGWVATDVSDGGAFDAAAGTVSWTVAGAALVEGKTLAYRVTAAETLDNKVTFSGSVANSADAGDRTGVSGQSALLVGRPDAECQTPELEDNFEEDPEENGWVLNGSAVWIPPETEECFDPNFLDPNPCSLYPDEDAEAFGGYILVTPGQTSQGGNAFFTEKTLFDSFTMEVVIEIRDGSIGRPADGMTIMLLGTEEPPNRVGGGGGSMGATGLGPVPTMIFEFDDWNNGASDQNSDNHVGFHWSPDGAGLTNDVLVPIQDVRLHNQQPHPADPNRFRMVVSLQDGEVACALAAIDQDIDLGELYRFEIPDFEPYLGYFGVTASTGGASQNHLLHSVRITSAEPCFDPLARVEREIEAPRDRGVFCGDFLAGDRVRVSLTIAELRASAGTCVAPRGLEIRETVPAGWDVEDFSDGGTLEAGTSTITWTLSGGDLRVDKVLTYQAVGADTGEARARFDGTAADTGDDQAQPVRIAGDRSLLRGRPAAECIPLQVDDNFDDDPAESGWILNGAAVWVAPDSIPCDDPNLVDPLDPCTLWDEDTIDEWAEDADEFGGYILVTSGQNSQVGNAFFSERTLFDDFRMEVVVELRDGSIARPADGMTIVLIGTDEPPATVGGGGGNMGATGLGNVPTMAFEFDDWNNGASDQDSDNHVAFHWSSSGLSALTNDAFAVVPDVRLHNQEPHPATPNRFRMTVSVEGGEVACALEAIDQGIDLGELYRYQIPDFEPFEGFVGVTGSTGGASQNHLLHSVRIEPLEPPAPPGTRFRRGDPDNSGGVNIADAVGVLNFLFGGVAGELACTEAADADNSGSINITDPVAILNFLFAGGGDPAPPGPETCGFDPDGAGGENGTTHGCGTYTSC